jgi:methyl-accepting chemotaxis protein
MTINVDVHVHFHASVDELKDIKAMLASLLHTGERTMSAISDFAAAQKSFNDRIDSAVSGLSDDISQLNAKIEELQTSPGTITPEDQALLNELQQRGEAIATKLEALDAMTPPTPPAVV